MINSWKMLKACQQQDSNPEAAKPTFSPVLTLQLQPRENLLPPSTTLCSSPLPLPGAGAAQAPAAQSGADWERGAKAGRAQDGGTARKGAKNSPGGRV